MGPVGQLLEDPGESSLAGMCTVSHTPGVPQCVHTQPHLPMASAARRRSNTAIGVNCTRVEALMPHVHVITTAVGPVVLLRTQFV